MTKQELIEENNKLLAKIEELEKDINEKFMYGENNVLYQVNSLLRENISFYQEILRNLTRKEGENNDN